MSMKMDRGTIRAVVQHALLEWADIQPSRRPIPLNNAARRSMAEHAADALVEAEKKLEDQPVLDWIMTGEGEMPP